MQKSMQNAKKTVIGSHFINPVSDVPKASVRGASLPTFCWNHFGLLDAPFHWFADFSKD